MKLSKKRNKFEKIKKYSTKRKLLTILGMAVAILALLVGYTIRNEFKEYQFKSNIAEAKVTEEPQHFADSNDKVTNDLSISEMVQLQQKAIEQGINKQSPGHIYFPTFDLSIPIYMGTNQLTLSLGATTYFYEDAQMGKGNYVLGGHNMEMPGVMFSDLSKLTKGDAVDLIDTEKTYRYRVSDIFVIPPKFSTVQGRPEEGSFLSLPKEGERAKLTLFTCIYTARGKERLVVQGYLE